MEPPAKKSEPTPFTEQNSIDDICLQFDDGKKLYVHPVFLFLVSPVFKAMFDHDCVEKKTNTITLQEKKYEDFLEFLMCLHPAHQRLVDQSTVLRMVRLASEYQVPSIASKCQAVMESWLSASVENAKNCNKSNDVFNYLKTCLVILDIGYELDSLDVKTKAIAAVARFGIELYTDHLVNRRYIYYPRDKGTLMRKECTDMFAKLPDSCKQIVFLERLKLIDKNEMP